jgi:hypothetical protein
LPAITAKTSKKNQQECTLGLTRRPVLKHIPVPYHGTPMPKRIETAKFYCLYATKIYKYLIYNVKILDSMGGFTGGLGPS